MLLLILCIIAMLMLSWYTAQPKHIGKWTDWLWWATVIGGGLSLAGMMIK